MKPRRLWTVILDALAAALFIAMPVALIYLIGDWLAALRG